MRAAGRIRDMPETAPPLYGGIFIVAIRLLFLRREFLYGRGEKHFRKLGMATLLLKITTKEKN